MNRFLLPLTLVLLCATGHTETLCGQVVAAITGTTIADATATLHADGASIAGSTRDQDKGFASGTVPSASGGVMTVRVLEEESGEPIADATVPVRTDDVRSVLVSDASGQVQISLPANLQSILSIQAQRDGYVPMLMYWNMPSVPVGDLPETYTFKLKHALSGGGRVVDASGVGIAGAQVSIIASTPPPRPALDLFHPVTDAEGRWQAQAFAADMANLMIQAEHPDFVNNNEYDKVPAEKLLSFRKELVLRRGVRLEGLIVDASGEPIPGVSVTAGDYGMVRTKSDAQGRFVLKNLDAGTVNLTVQEKGYAPDMIKTIVAQGSKPVQIVMKPGRVLRLRCIDRSGAPLPGIAIGIERWRMMMSLRPIGMDSEKTDAGGRLVWDSAPEDAVEYRVQTRGWVTTSNLSIVADGKEKTLVLTPPLTLWGEVVDASSGAPIANFSVMPVLVWKSGSTPFVERSSSKSGRDGKYSITLSRSDVDYMIRVEAIDYAPALSARYKVDAGSIELDFALRPAANLVGTIVDASGEPVEGAEVALSSAMQQVDVFRGEIPRKNSTLLASTDRDGRFTLPPQEDDFLLVALHDRGFATVSRRDFRNGAKIFLAPWARIEGQVFDPGPVAGQSVDLDSFVLVDPASPHFFNRTNVMTDKDGRFVFERVALGQATIYPYTTVWEECRLMASERIPLEIKPGETRRITFGKEGAEITGRLACSQLPADFDWNYALNYLVELKPGIAPPPEVAPLGFDVMKGWTELWLASREGQVYLVTLHHWLFKLNHDGSFRIHGVSPGRYQVALRVYEPPIGNACLVNPIIRKVLDVIVPRQATGPIQLGTIPVELATLKAGDVAPDFEVATLDGKTARISDYRGKYLLLDFWATWCGPCVAALPDIRAIRETYKSRKDFAVLSVSLDKEMATVKRFLDRDPPDWPQGFGGDYSTSRLPARYGISWIPALFLIGPDGTVIARDLSPADARRELEARFAKNSGN